MRKFIFLCMMLILIGISSSAKDQNTVEEQRGASTNNSIPQYLYYKNEECIPQMEYKRKQKKHPHRGFGNHYDTTFVYPHVEITNEDLNEFLTTTLAPVLRSYNIDSYNGVVTMPIIEKDGKLYVQCHFTDDGYIDFWDLPEGYESLFCIVDGFPIKIEAPENCPLLKYTDKVYTLVHSEGLSGTSDYPQWFFHTEGDSLVFDEVQFVFPDQKYEGKTINESTGRLE